MSRIRQLREALGWSQEELADRAGVGQPTISAYESGKRSPTYKTLKPIADALGVHVRDLMERGDKPLTRNELLDAYLDGLPKDVPDDAKRKRVEHYIELLRAEFPEENETQQ